MSVLFAVFAALTTLGCVDDAGKREATARAGNPAFLAVVTVVNVASHDDIGIVKGLLDQQFAFIRSEDWESLYSLCPPSTRAQGTYEQFLSRVTNGNDELPGDNFRPENPLLFEGKESTIRLQYFLSNGESLLEQPNHGIRFKKEGSKWYAQSRFCDSRSFARSADIYWFR